MVLNVIKLENIVVKVISTTLIVFFFSLSIALAGYTDSGIKKYNKGKYKSAEKYLTKALSKNPNDLRAQLYQALIYINTSRGEEAFRLLQIIILKKPSSQEAISAKKILDGITRKVTIKTGKDNVTIVKDLKINKQPAGVFILDTGATYTCISKKTAKKLKLKTYNAPKITMQTANGRVKARLITVDYMSLKGLTAKDVKVAIVDIDKKYPELGLLGISFLGQFKMYMDKQAGTVVLQEKY